MPESYHMTQFMDENSEGTAARSDNYSLFSSYSSYPRTATENDGLEICFENMVPKLKLVADVSAELQDCPSQQQLHLEI